MRYSLDCKLIFVDTASSDSWVVDILSRIQPHSGSSSQPQLERCCYSKVCIPDGTYLHLHMTGVTIVVIGARYMDCR